MQKGKYLHISNPVRRKSVCARKTEHTCWMNLGKTASLLCCLWKITSTTPGLSLMLFTSISSKSNKYEKQTPRTRGLAIQHSRSNIFKQDLEKNLAEAEQLPLSTQQTSPEYPDKCWQDRRQYVATGYLNNTILCQGSSQQPSCSPSWWESPPEMWTPGSGCACRAALCKSHLKKYTEL